MKVVAGILLTVSLAIGALGAASAYLVPLDQVSDDELIGLRLKADAGKLMVDGQEVPIVKKGTELTADPIAKLRAANVQYLWVNEFNWKNWPGLYLFLVSLVGFVACAILVHAGSKQSAALAGLAEIQTPEAALANLRTAIDELHDRMVLRESGDTESKAPMYEDELLPIMSDALTEIQQKHVAAFVDSRQQLVKQLGLARMAEIMDSFARAERQINRAWSAAADKVYDEAAACINSAREFLQATAEKLQPSS